LSTRTTSAAKQNKALLILSYRAQICANIMDDNSHAQPAGPEAKRKAAALRQEENPAAARGNVEARVRVA